MAYPTPITAAPHAYKYPSSTRPRGRLCLVSLANLNRLAPSPQDFRACAGDISQQSATFPSAAPVSPAQNRRVSDLIQGTGFSTPALSQRSPSSGTTMQRHHANSAPSSTVSLAGQHSAVPRFLDSSFGSPQQHFDMLHMDSMPGTSPQKDLGSSFVLTSCSLGMEFLNDLEMVSSVGHSELQGDLASAYHPDLVSYSSGQHSMSSTDMTISPSDLHYSMPPSAATDFQPTPDTEAFDSPQAIYSGNPSPDFYTLDSPAVNDNLDQDVAAPLGKWFPDLPGTNDVEVPIAKPALTKTVAMSRKDSSQSSGKSPRGSRSSLTSGITKPKKRQGKLKEMNVDPNDPSSYKRCRNTLAARNSRARRQQRMEDLEQECVKWKKIAYDLGYQGDENEED
ncbi:MAG: hypothetical protein Q9218_002074 [Villophora microphyllina]